MKKISLTLLVWLITASVTAQETTLQTLEKELKELKQTVKEQEKKIEASATAIENKNTGHSIFGNTKLGGYGEIHMNQLWDKDDSATSKRQIDFHRFVLFVEHKFNDNIKFFSEIEIEHVIASSSKKGEIELEQAFIDFQYSTNHHVIGGLFLIPVGIINETHEPNAFYGVERNLVERNILPATWWEGGVLFKGNITNQLSYDAAIHSGLKTDAAGKYAIRNGRQQVSEAEARGFGLTTRISYKPMAGLDLNLALQYQTDVTQKSEVDSVSAYLINLNATYQCKDFSIKALFASWSLNGDGPKSFGADKTYGYYIEPSYRINEKWGVFARFSQYDTTAGSKGGKTAKSIVNLGVNFWPHESVVLKFDIEDQYNENQKGESLGFNLGLGYQF
jgi:hypothetical protein